MPQAPRGDRPTGASPGGGAGTDDERLLRSLGYGQELFRRMSGLSNFAISFSMICILAGGITSLQLGLSAVGGATAGVAWPAGVGFCWLVALGMAQIASAFPTAGGLYHCWIGVQPPNEKALAVTVIAVASLTAAWWLGVRAIFPGPPMMSVAAQDPPPGAREGGPAPVPPEPQVS